jgi:porphobilinogen synthase
MNHPTKRHRRLRQSPMLRRMVRENIVQPKNLIQPIFVVHGNGRDEEISSMPGVRRYSLDQLKKPIEEIISAHIPAVILFGIPENKDQTGSGAYAENGIIQNAIKAIKDISPNLMVISDVCLCEYMSHGHCGILDKRGDVDNDLSVELLVQTALSHVNAGADIVAPSDMMDGRILKIRNALDESGFSNTPIMSYAAKYASAFYGPFREAAESTPSHGDRKSYQMDPGNVREAIKEVIQDVEEGADIVMVKPAMPYLDVITKVKEATNVPIAAYQVSGEYTMIQAAAERGWLDKREAMEESLTAIKRAGADLIISYFATQFAKGLK